jgi:hypothetical protein
MRRVGVCEVGDGISDRYLFAVCVRRPTVREIRISQIWTGWELGLVLGQDRMGRAPIHGWSLPCTTLVGCAQAGWYIGGVSREMLGVVKSAHRFFV